MLIHVSKIGSINAEQDFMGFSHHACINGLVQDSNISIANALEILQSCTKPLIYYIDGLVQERCNSIANALELHLSCTHPPISGYRP